MLNRIPDQARSRLRTTLASIQRDLAALPEASVSRLRDSVADLADQLALGPEPEYRNCPVCGEVGMRAATRCGNCWSPLPPLAASDDIVR